MIRNRVKTCAAASIAALTTLTTLIGCASAAPAKGDLAMLSAPSAQTIAELEQIVSAAMNGIEVTIAPDALIKKSTLFIEKKPLYAPNGLPIMGRIMEKPDHFTLTRSGNKCVLTHEETGKHYFVKTAQCESVG